MTRPPEVRLIDRSASDTAVSAAVLAGGGSRRFGVDKALVPSPVDGRPVLERTVALLCEISDDVTVIAPRDRSYERFGAPVVSESAPGRGPLGGIETALTIARHGRCLIVACDLPLLRLDLLRWLVAVPFDGDALVPFVGDLGGESDPNVDLRPQPLLAVYRTTVLPEVRKLLQDGERRVQCLIDVIRVVSPTVDSLRDVDPALVSFRNINTREELSTATRLARDAVTSRGTARITPFRDSGLS